MDSFGQDLKVAARELAHDKAFLLTAGLTLALCIGANTTIFSVVNAIVLRPLPIPEPDRLVTMWNAYPGAAPASETGGSNAAPDYFDRRALTDVFEEVAEFRRPGRSIEIQGVAQRVSTVAATPSLFTILRAEAELGRTFAEREGEPGNDHVVILSYGLWEQLYGGDRGVLGRDLRIDQTPYTIVGVMPPEFRFLRDDVRLWTPLAFTPEQRREYHSNSYTMVARLQPGVSLQRAQEQIDALNRHNMDRTPELKPLLLDAGFHTPVVPLQQQLVRSVRSVLFLLWGGIAFVLLIGCVNVANLMLVRATARSRELATRFALGAGRGRVARQLVVEVVLLTLGAGAVGLLVGEIGLRALGGLGLGDLPRAYEVGLDAAAVGFTVALSLAVGAVVSLIPLVNILRVDLSSVFREQGRTGTASRGVRALRKGLVAAQVAFALILLTGAGLLLSSFARLLAVDPGFEPRGVLSGTVVLTPSGYSEVADQRRYVDEMLRRIRALPGVQAAGVTTQLPFGDNSTDSVIFAEGYVMQPGESVISPAQSVVSPGYFEAMGIRLLQGRLFDARDNQDGAPAIIIDRRLARRFFPDGDAVGRRMWRPTSVEDITDPANAEYFEIVGVVEAIRLHGLDLAGGSGATGGYYFPLQQQPRRGLSLVIKTSGDPLSLVAPVRRELAAIDPDLPFFDVQSMEARIARSLDNRRTPMLLVGVFGVAALLLAAIGLYGALAYLVQLRTKEVGIRVAMGSDAKAIFRLVLREGATIVAIGVAVGLGGTALLRRFLESQLYAVSSMDPLVWSAAAAMLALVALIACAIPAWRATRIDPVAALNEQ